MLTDFVGASSRALKARQIIARGETWESIGFDPSPERAGETSFALSGLASILLRFQGFHPLVSTHFRRSGVAWHNEPGHLFKVIEVIMFEQFKCRQETPKTSQQCWRSGLPAPNLSTAQSHQEIAQGDRLRIRCALDVPDYDTAFQ
jgi:hypothetical protein